MHKVTVLSHDKTKFHRLANCQLRQANVRLFKSERIWHFREQIKTYYRLISNQMAWMKNTYFWHHSVILGDKDYDDFIHVSDNQLTQVVYKKWCTHTHTQSHLQCNRVRLILKIKIFSWADNFLFFSFIEALTHDMLIILYIFPRFFVYFKCTYCWF